MLTRSCGHVTVYYNVFLSRYRRMNTRLSEPWFGQWVGQRQGSVRVALQQCQGSIRVALQQCQGSVTAVSGQRYSSVRAALQQCQGSVRVALQQCQGSVTATLGQHYSSVTAALGQHYSSVSVGLGQRYSSVTAALQQCQDRVRAALGVKKGKICRSCFLLVFFTFQHQSFLRQSLKSNLKLQTSVSLQILFKR